MSFWTMWSGSFFDSDSLEVMICKAENENQAKESFVKTFDHDNFNCEKGLNHAAKILSDDFLNRVLQDNELSSISANIRCTGHAID